MLFRSAAIGQGDTSITPLQLAMAYAAIANGGTVYQPRVAKAIVSAQGEVLKEFEPVARGTVDVPPQALWFLRDALSGVTANGTARVPFEGFPLDQIPIASKTGSAQVYGDKSTTAWFASFAPADNPRYAVVMMITQGGTGSLTVGPSIRTIYEALFGVSGSVVDPTKSVLVGGSPSDTLPIVKPDGTPVGPDPVPAIPGTGVDDSTLATSSSSSASAYPSESSSTESGPSP